jgi:hypothetical protein
MLHSLASFGPDTVDTVPTQASVQTIMADGTTSDWLKAALRSALQRDPVDSLNDALLLSGLLEERLRLLFEVGESREGSKQD